MTNQEEIDILQSLKGDTQFASVFGQDIDQMCENIKKGVRILVDTTIDVHIESLSQMLAKASNELKEAKEEATRAMINYRNECDGSMKSFISELMTKGDADKYEYIKDEFGELFALRVKYEAEGELEDSDIELLFELAGA